MFKPLAAEQLVPVGHGQASSGEMRRDERRFERIRWRCRISMYTSSHGGFCSTAIALGGRSINVDGHNCGRRQAGSQGARVVFQKQVAKSRRERHGPNETPRRFVAGIHHVGACCATIVRRVRATGTVAVAAFETNASTHW